MCQALVLSRNTNIHLLGLVDESPEIMSCSHVRPCPWQVLNQRPLDMSLSYSREGILIPFFSSRFCFLSN